jgi:hypothetical protein
MVFNKEKLLTLGGVHQDPVMKWKQKQREAEAQGPFKPQ